MVREDFFDDAELFLRTNARLILDQFSLEPREGTWHPNGFAVFHLGDVDGLGRMRIHIWPRGRRICLDGQPAIHSHPWDLCSLVIAGCYRDTRYRPREFSADAAGRLRGFQLRFGPKNVGDRAVPVAKWYELTVTEERIVAQGGVHTMLAGALHASNVPFDAFVATLLITSKVVDMRKLVLVGDDKFPETTYVRPPVSAEELNQMTTDLPKALAMGLISSSGASL